ncbi:MAG: chromosomal replication initiator protein DnaA [Planctomycetes bacterium]|nr:chromosomal replication initiator protein DnaA [Planctomycetota bacterium]
MQPESLANAPTSSAADTPLTNAADAPFSNAANAPTTPADEIESRLNCELQQRIGAANYRNWFQQKVRLTIRDDELTVGVGSPFLLNWMQKQFRGNLVGAAQAVLGPSAVVRFEVSAEPLADSAESAAARTTTLSADPVSPATIESPQGRGASREKQRPARGRRFADFSDFVVGGCNEMAFLAASHVCESPGTLYNPLFIHGGVGLGKTHLLEGIYRKIRRDFPALKTLYFTSESFTNYFMTGLRDHTLPSFRQRFRSVDVLLVDDIGFLDSKPATQQEFLHTLEHLLGRNRQVVVTADRHPRLLTGLCEELSTRFVSGLVCRIEPADLETRMKIVEHKAARTNAVLTKQALQFVASRFQNNVRELEGGLNCLANFHSMTGKPVRRADARRILADLERDCIQAVRIPDVEKAVCNLFGVDPDDLRSAKRQRSLSQPRMLAMYLSRKLVRAAYTEIGSHFGGRNHSTVISAEKKVNGWLEEDRSITVAARSWPLHEVIATLKQQLRVS